MILQSQEIVTQLVRVFMQLVSVHFSHRNGGKSALGPISGFVEVTVSALPLVERPALPWVRETTSER
ncbi:hypothetical protein ACWEPL_62340 [Nonomuraea sp. NPDC004186]